MAIRAVIFDLDGTINRSARYYRAYDRYAISVLADLLKLPKKEVHSKMQELRGIAAGFTRRVELAGIPRSAFYEEMARRIPCKELIQSDARLKAMLQKLRTEGYKLALLTNTGRPLVEKVMDALGTPQDIFDVLVTSSETGLKPDDEPYLHVASELAVSLQDCLYVGDRYEMEVEKAKKLGMKTVLLTDSFLEDSARRGNSECSIESIYDIPILLRDADYGRKGGLLSSTHISPQ